jgi:flagellar assembly factor FliW
MKIDTTRFGVLEVDDDSVVSMPRGPLGFEDNTEFVLIQHRPDTKFRWLQSTADPALAFVVIDPSDFFADYEFEISDADAEKLNLDSADDALVLAIVTISEGGKEVTANLAAPVVINSKELVGMQIVLQDGRYSVKHSLIGQTDGKGTREETVAKVA